MINHKKYIQSAAMVLIVLIGSLALLSHFSASESTPIQTSNPVISGDVPTRAASKYSAEQSMSMDGSENASGGGPLLTPSSISIVKKHKPDTSTPLRLIYDDLKSAAMNGDPDAALELAGALVECVEAAANADKLELQLLQLYQTRHVSGSARQVEDLDYEAEKIRNRFTFCEAISREKVKEHYKFMRVAAESGSVEAKVRQASYGPMLESEVFEAINIAWKSSDEMRIVTNRFHYEAARAGEVSSMLSIGRRMENGGDLMSAEEARAYRIAGYHLSVIQGLNVEKNGPRLKQEIYSIRPVDRADALDAANSLLARESCCFFIR